MDWIERELEAAVRARSWEDDGLQAQEFPHPKHW
jgi:hypothetical protein